MAATKKKTSNRGKRQTKQEPAAGNFSTEIVLILFLALSIIMLISNFGVGGMV